MFTNKSGLKKNLNYDKYLLLILIILSTIVVFWKLGQGSLDDWDEAIYAQVAKEILNSGDWLTLHWNYYEWFHKPPLFMWSTSLLYSLFGVDEFWARASSAICSVVTVIMTYLIGKLIYDQKVGFLAGLILLTSYQFVAQSRFGTTDIMLTMFISMAIYSYLKVTKDLDQEAWWYLVGLCCGLSIMTKGVAGLVAPLVIIISVITDKKLMTTLRSVYFWQGVLCCFLVFLPWHIFMYFTHGQNFLETYLGYHVINRATTAIEGHDKDRMYYLSLLKGSFFPWFYLLQFAIVIKLQEIFDRQDRHTVLLNLLLVPFCLYTIANTKLPWYIMPVYPALAIYVSYLLNQIFFDNRVKLTDLKTSIFLFATFFVALAFPFKIVFLPTYLKQFVSLMLIIGLIVGIYMSAQKIINIRWFLIVLLLLYFLAGIREVRGLYYGKQRDIAKISQIAGRSHQDQKKPLIAAKLTESINMPTTLFYSNRPIVWVRNEQDLNKYITVTDEIIMGKKDVENLSKNFEIQELSHSGKLIYAQIKPLN